MDEERYAAEFLAADRALADARLRALRGVQRRPARPPRPAQQRLLAAGAVHRARALRPQRVRPDAAVEPARLVRVRARERRGARRGGGQEELSDEAVALEEVYLGLRTSDGLAPDLLPPDTVAAWTEAGWAQTIAGPGPADPGGVAAPRRPGGGSLRRSRRRHLGARLGAAAADLRAGGHVGILAHPVALIGAAGADGRAGRQVCGCSSEPRIMKSALVRQISAQSSSRRTESLVEPGRALAGESGARPSRGRCGGSWYSPRCTAPSCAGAGSCGWPYVLHWVGMSGSPGLPRGPRTLGPGRGAVNPNRFPEPCPQPTS